MRRVALQVTLMGVEFSGIQWEEGLETTGDFLWGLKRIYERFANQLGGREESEERKKRCL